MGSAHRGRQEAAARDGGDRGRCSRRSRQHLDRPPAPSPRVPQQIRGPPDRAPPVWAGGTSSVPTSVSAGARPGHCTPRPVTSIGWFVGCTALTRFPEPLHRDFTRSRTAATATTHLLSASRNGSTSISSSSTATSRAGSAASSTTISTALLGADLRPSPAISARPPRVTPHRAPPPTRLTPDRAAAS